VVAAVARQKITVNPAIVDLFMVSLRRCCFANADEDYRRFDPARFVGRRGAGSVDRATA
jgi:hypothetical protein